MDTLRRIFTNLFKGIQYKRRGEGLILLLLSIYALLLLSTPLYLKGNSISKLGLFLVIGASLYGGLKGGLLSFLWMSGILLGGYLFLPTHFMLTQTLLTIGVYLFIAVGLGKSIEYIYLQQSTIREGEARTEALLEAFPDMIFTFSQEGIILDYYASSEDMLLLDPDSFLSEKVEDVLPKALAKTTMYYLERLFLQREAQIYRYELEIRGEMRDFEGRLVLYGEDKALAIVRDITQLVAMNRELTKSRKEYRDLIHTMGEGIITMSLEGEILFANPAAYRIFGVMSGELVGRDLRDFLEEREAHRVKVKREAHILGETDSYDVRIVRPDGERRIIHVTTSPNKSDGRITSLFSVVRDITKQRLAEEDLKESKEYIQSILEVIPDIIICYDKEGTYLDIFSSTENKLYKGREELLGRRIVDVLPEKEGIRLYNGVFKALETNSLQIVEYLLEVPDGRLWFEARIIPQGEGMALSLIRDITDERRAREQIIIQHTMGLELAKVNDLKSAFHIFLDAALAIAEMESGGMYLVEEDTGRLVLIHHKGFRTKDYIESTSWFEPDSLLALTLMKGEPIYSLCKQKVFHPATMREEGLTFLGILPIKNNGEVIAFLKVASHTLETISPSVRTALESIAAQIGSIIARIQAEERVRYISFHDSLTGLYNRGFLEEEMKRLDTNRQLPISIIFGDLNGLKLINDTYGHDMGDRLLEKTGEILKRTCREEDIISRWGGDEFVVFLPRTCGRDTERICRRIREEASRESVRDIPVQISLGFSTKEGEESMQSVLQDAEDRMYSEKMLQGRSTRGVILSTLFKSLEEKSKETSAHIGRLQEMGERIGEIIGLPSSEIERLSLLLTLHDIGKITIPERILNKRAPLNQEEWRMMKNHPQTGHRIAMAMEKYAPVASDILSHHEHWDGSGYPQGLKEEEIPLLSRICSVVDAYDVMTHHTPYGERKTHKEALEELERCAGTQFDPTIVKIFKEISYSDRSEERLEKGRRRED